MTHSCVRALTLLVGAALPAALVASPATARPVEGGPYHEEFTFTFTDFCDVPGLTVDYAAVVDGHYVANSRGPGGPVYYVDHQRLNQTYTNPATGLTATDVQRVLVKDLKITKDGNIVTIVQLATGYETTYGPDGRVIARNPGQSRFRIVFNDNGTPADDSDDTEISFEQIKGSTGRSDDFCTAVVAAIG